MILGVPWPDAWVAAFNIDQNLAVGARAVANGPAELPVIVEERPSLKRGPGLGLAPWAVAPHGK
eukprot:5024010-Pyramimonas_sp.AAC.1